MATDPLGPEGGVTRRTPREWLTGSNPDIYDDPWSSLSLTRKFLRTARYLLIGLVLFEALTWPILTGFEFVGLTVATLVLTEGTILAELCMVDRQLKNRVVKT